MTEPFQQGRFSALPKAPRVAHPYFELPCQRVPVESRRFGSHHVYLKRVGSGPPLLLVHGLMTSSYSWRYVLEPLAKHFTVFAPDLPGAGRTDHILPAEDSQLYSAASLSEWLGELVSALQIRGALAVGNSLGGYLCLRAALDDTGLFSKVVNIHSPARPEPRLYALHAALKLPGARRALTAAIQRAPERWAHRNVHYWDESLKSLEEAREYAAPLATRNGCQTFIEYLAQTVAPHGFKTLLARLTELRDRNADFPVPLMLVYAEKDPMVSPKNGAALRALLPRARFEQLTRASHFPHVDAPERLLPLLLDFLGVEARKTGLAGEIAAQPKQS